MPLAPLWPPVLAAWPFSDRAPGSACFKTAHCRCHYNSTLSLSLATLRPLSLARSLSPSLSLSLFLSLSLSFALFVVAYYIIAHGSISSLQLLLPLHSRHLDPVHFNFVRWFRLISANIVALVSFVIIIIIFAIRLATNPLDGRAALIQTRTRSLSLQRSI